MRWRDILPLLLFMLCQQMFAGVYSFQKTPNWVKSLEIPTSSDFSKYDILSGYYLSLADYQIELDNEEIYTREVRNVISYSGITNASQLSVQFDTTYQDLHIHHLYIWRDGQKIDRTSELTFEVLNNEENLDYGIYSGSITVYDILNDIRKDDMIDFAYTLKGYNPIFENEQYFFISLEGYNPYDRYSLRFIYDKEKGYEFTCDSLVYSDTIIGEKRIVEIDQYDVPPVKNEDGMPAWEVPYRYFALTSMHSWIEVNNWAQRVFKLEQEPDLTEVFDEIFTGNEEQEQKIDKIIDFVQDEIRYMGIEQGIGSVKPFTPNQVVKQRYGDCKDKSLLLVSLLKKIGIEEAYPVLVNSIMLEHVEMVYPSNKLFNHCIACFKYNGTTYYVDPTIAQQGGTFKKLYVPDYGKVLIVGVASDSLTEMPIQGEPALTEYVEEYNLESFTEAGTLKIISNRYGGDADVRRSFLDYSSTSDILKELTKTLKHQFPVVEQTSDVEVVDSMEINKISNIYNYKVNGHWNGNVEANGKRFPNLWVYTFEPSSIKEFFW